MILATRIAPAGTWPAATSELTLDYNHRHRRRLRLNLTDGTEILLNLAEATHIRDGDAISLENGAYIAIHAAPEDLLEVTAPDPETLARLAWHLGNRHLAVQFCSGALRILYDHVIAEMITGLDGTARKISAPFDPESGAYAHE